MKCNFCGNKDVVRKNVDYIYRNSGKMLFVQNVPCEECSYCGERYFEAKELKKIEDAFFNIINNKRKPKSRIEVPVEDFETV